MNHNQRVRLVRTLRDGSITVENMPRWLAEMLVGTISTSEPNTARARIVSDDETVPVSHDPYQSVRGMALALYLSSTGSQTFAGQVAH